MGPKRSQMSLSSSSDFGRISLNVSTNVAALYVKKPTSIGISSNGITSNLGTTNLHFHNLKLCEIQGMMCLQNDHQHKLMEFAEGG